MTINTNPFNLKYEEVVISKFNGSDRMNVTPQVLEVVLYQSIFQSLIKADIVFNDYIGLMNNYPLSGEENVEINIEYEDDGGKKTKRLYFIVVGIKEIKYTDDARGAVYVFELASVEAFINSNSRVSHAYFDTIENMIKSVYEEYVTKHLRPVDKKKNLDIIEDTTKVRKLVVPNIKPFDAIAWLCKFAISANPDKYYTQIFYETLEGFQFKPLQRITYRGDKDEAAIARCIKKKFIYISNFENFKKDSNTYDKFLADGYDDSRVINELRINKRYSVLEKIIGGYFENELVETNILQKDYKITYTELKDDGSFNTLYPTGIYNTPEYLDAVKKEYDKPEESARVRYIVNNYDDTNQPSFRDKFGPSSRSFLAFQQVDLSLSIPSDIDMRPGDIIWVDLPEVHGFNVNEKDRYLSGLFLVSEIKTIMRVGGKSQSYIRINKDSWNRKLKDKHDYAFDTGSPVTSTTNPMGPR